MCGAHFRQTFFESARFRPSETGPQEAPHFDKGPYETSGGQLNHLASPPALAWRAAVEAATASD